MAFNRFMHPRNMYKAKPPNFQELAEKYSEFRAQCTIDCSGKMLVNFKNPEAVRALTRALLLENFDLDVELPAGSLVPRIPQRLNYILWIEDMLMDNESLVDSDKIEPNSNLDINNGTIRSITGIDIGTGASCVYPLLAAKQCGWNFIATDKDPDAVSCARNNVSRNGLDSRIQIVQVEEKTAICGALNQNGSERSFDFTMCNPPFYDLSEVADHESGFLRCCTFVDYSESAVNKRTRPDPHSNTVAKQSEICAEGGEYAFVSRIIDDSAVLRNRIRIYTSMIGKKANLGPLKAKLRSVCVASVCQTMFCQGKTQRWALAWTFDPKIKLNSQQQDGNNKKKPPCHRLEFPSCLAKAEEATNKLLQMFDEIKILHRKTFPVETTAAGCSANGVSSGKNGVSVGNENYQIFSRFECHCFENTWSNQRRKRRMKLQKRIEDSNEGQPEKKKSCLNGNGDSYDDKPDNCNNSATEHNDLKTNGSLNNSGGGIISKPKEKEPPTANGRESVEGKKEPSSEARNESQKIFLKFSVSVGCSDNGNAFANLEWIEGENKDHLHQILQFLKNSLSTKEAN